MAKQIEYWADLGRRVSSTLDPDVLLSISSGLTVLKAEPVMSAPINPVDVFKSLENNRKSGALQEGVTNSVVRYQASSNQLGYLEKIDKDGRTTVGQFQNGQFVAITDERLGKR